MSLERWGLLGMVLLADELTHFMCDLDAVKPVPGG